MLEVRTFGDWMLSGTLTIVFVYFIMYCTKLVFVFPTEGLLVAVVLFTILGADIELHFFYRVRFRTLLIASLVGAVFGGFFSLGLRMLFSSAEKMGPLFLRFLFAVITGGAYGAGFAVATVQASVAAIAAVSGLTTKMGFVGSAVEAVWRLVHEQSLLRYTIPGAIAGVISGFMNAGIHLVSKS